MVLAVLWRSLGLDRVRGPREGCRRRGGSRDEKGGEEWKAYGIEGKYNVRPLM